MSIPCSPPDHMACGLHVDRLGGGFPLGFISIRNTEKSTLHPLATLDLPLYHITVCHPPKHSVPPARTPGLPLHQYQHI